MLLDLHRIQSVMANGLILLIGSASRTLEHFAAMQREGTLA